MFLKRKLFESVLTLSRFRNILLHLFHGKSLLNLWRWLLLLSSLALTTSCIATSPGRLDRHGNTPSTIPCQYFVGYSKSKLFQTTSRPKMYYRCIDDIFVVFSHEDECNIFLNSLNSLLFSLLRKESNMALLFLDARLVEKSLSKFITSIFRKPTFTGQYTLMDT